MVIYFLVPERFGGSKQARDGVREGRIKQRVGIDDDLHNYVLGKMNPR